MLNLQGRPVLFVGGGWETEHKVRGLLEAGAKVRLISPESHPGLSSSSTLIWEHREYVAGDLEGFLLVVSHPGDKSLNAKVASEARERGIWINAVDDPQYCDFILPSVHRQGDLVIAVSTSGAAPALGVRIKQHLAEEYGPEYAEYLRLLRSFRPIVAQTYPDDFEARKAAWYRMVDSLALELIRISDPEAAKACLLNAMRDISDPIGTQDLASPPSPQIDEVIR
ncbi:MAG: bifunctional precorrin-2 dehydrogenase/sirohydrochlorin ferrochelatase [Thermaceae bacterium]|nr:bifunctional precorrin-2 dehydrogenase/sirohydrochlorin ferrochelatase [Thermaceae bacterium]